MGGTVDPDTVSQVGFPSPARAPTSVLVARTEVTPFALGSANTLSYGIFGLISTSAPVCGEHPFAPQDPLSSLPVSTDP